MPTSSWPRKNLPRHAFLTTIAHELRTPLMATNGYLQLIRSGIIPEESFQSTLETVSNNLQQITTLVNDILFVQEMDLILSDFRPVDLGDVVAAAARQQEAHARKNHTNLKIETSKGAPIILGDERSLERAVAAILDNAIKFSPNGGDVVVEVGSDAAGAFIRISDHGVGIPPDALPRIFDRFFHLEEVGDHLFRGVGLGLAIARQVIEQHQGSISVQSELEKGSVFTVYLKSM